jgi:hypothetical protein
LTGGLPNNIAALSVKTERVLFDVDTLFCSVISFGARYKSQEKVRVNLLRKHLSWKETENFYARPLQPAQFANAHMEQSIFDHDENYQKWLRFCGTPSFRPIVGSVRFESDRTDEVASFKIGDLEPPVTFKQRLGAAPSLIGRP